MDDSEHAFRHERWSAGSAANKQQSLALNSVSAMERMNCANRAKVMRPVRSGSTRSSSAAQPAVNDNDHGNGEFGRSKETLHDSRHRLQQRRRQSRTGTV